MIQQNNDGPSIEAIEAINLLGVDKPEAAQILAKSIKDKLERDRILDACKGYLDGRDVFPART